MKKLILFTFALFAVSTTIYSQSDYYFGYQDGFKYGCSCNDLPPKNVAYTQGTWNSGYLDGKIDGLKYASTSATQNSQPTQNTTTKQQQPTLYTPDYELLEKVLAEKQRVLNERRADIQNRIDINSAIINRLIAKNNGLTDSQKAYVEAVNTQINICNSWDLSIYENYHILAEYLNKVQAEIITWK